MSRRRVSGFCAMQSSAWPWLVRKLQLDTGHKITDFYRNRLLVLKNLEYYPGDTSNVRRRRLFISGNLEGGPTVWSAWSFSSLFLSYVPLWQRRHRGVPGRPAALSCRRTAPRGPATLASQSLGAFGITLAASRLRGAPELLRSPNAIRRPFPPEPVKKRSCNVVVVNTLTSAGAVSSTITATACLAAAGVPSPLPAARPRSPHRPRLVSSVNQCDGIVVGGGSNVTATSRSSTTFPAAQRPRATVNQCIGSGQRRGPRRPACAPVASTTNATVTQCNGSGTGAARSIAGK